MTMLLTLMFGAAGVLARIGVSKLFAPSSLGAWPVSTFAINVIGSLAIGAVYVLGVERAMLTPPLRTAIMVGLLGGFTTFSAFSLEVVQMLEAGFLWRACLYVTSSTVFGVGATYCGMLLLRR